MTPSYLAADLEPTERELTPPGLRGPAPRRARSYPDALTACAQCGGPLDGPSYGGACEGCAAANGEQDALVDRLCEAADPLPLGEHRELVAAAEDRRRPLAVRLGALRELSARSPFQVTRASCAAELERLEDPERIAESPPGTPTSQSDGAIARAHPRAIVIPGELAARLNRELGELKHLTGAERELWALLRRQLDPGDGYERPTTREWECGCCGATWRSTGTGTLEGPPCPRCHRPGKPRH